MRIFKIIRKKKMDTVLKTSKPPGPFLYTLAMSIVLKLTLRGRGIVKL